MSGIDWRSELRKIEREFDGLPPEPPKAEAAKPRIKLEPTVTRPPGLGQRTAPKALTVPKALTIPMLDAEQLSTLVLWGRVVLVGALALAIGFWPYAHTCGFPLWGYMGACAMIVVGGLWSSMCTWHARTAIAHVLSLVFVAAGIWTFALEIAPRVGYAHTNAGHPEYFWCATR